MRDPSPPRRAATPDPRLAARLVSRTPLRYAEGADARLDRPAHVRAGSSLAWVPGGMALVQDDANFLAVVDPAARRVRAVTLPVTGPSGERQFDDERGNKRHKLDLEACVTVHDGGGALLVILGSGSSERRERVALVDGWEAGAPQVTMHEAPALYDRLRREAAFAGAELNLEGAVVLGDRVRLFGRGNGAPRDGAPAVNATCDLRWPALLAHLRAPHDHAPPEPEAVVRYDLGVLDGVSLGFTDAAEWRDGALLYAAAAEDSPDAVRDGRVAGSAVGVIGRDGAVRWAPVTDADGHPCAVKVEGLLVADTERARADGARLWVVVDADDPHAPSELCAVELHGPWN